MSQVRLDTQMKGRMEPLISVDHLCVAFKKQRGLLRHTPEMIKAVDNISFDVYESEIFSLVGESGSGKTTTARCIMGLTRPTSGLIRYRGQDLRQLRGHGMREYRREVQVIYQDPYESLNPREDVFTIISTPIRNLNGERNHSTLVETVRSLLLEVGLDPAETLYKLPHQLSGGERQRINIARALAPQPKFLIADEPVTMLDASQKLNILSLLMKLKAKRSLTIVLITHDLASARIMSNITAIMYLGKIVEIGPTSRILSKPHHPYAQLILESTPRIGSSLFSGSNIEFMPSIEESQKMNKGCNYFPRCKYATAVCKEVEPPLEEKTGKHRAACHNPLNMI